MPIDDVYSLPGPRIANAQGFRGSRLNGNGGGHACSYLDVDTSPMTNPHPAFEIPFFRHRRCDVNESVVVLDQGFIELDTPDFSIKLVKASQTLAALQPKGADGFDFTPADQLTNRAANRFSSAGTSLLSFPL